MSTSTATSGGISDLMQILSNAATPAISSLFASSQVQSALSKASPTDVVELSEQAARLQEVDALFGSPASGASQDLLFPSLDVEG